MSEQIPGPKINPLSFLNNFIKSTNNKTPQGDNEIWNVDNPPKKYLQNESSDKEISETLIESQKELQNKPKMGTVVETRTMTLAQNMVEDGISTKEMRELNKLEPEEVVEVMTIYNDAVDEDTCFLNDCPQNKKEIDETVDLLIEATTSDKEVVAQAAEEILEEAVEITLENDKFEVTEHLVEVANDKTNANCAAAASIVTACEDIFAYYASKIISYFGYDWFQNTLQTIISNSKIQKDNSTKQNTSSGSTSSDKSEQGGYSGMNVEEIIQSDKCRDIDGNLYSTAVHSLANKLIAHPESFSNIDMNKLSVADKILIEAYYNRSGGDFKHDMEIYKTNKKIGKKPH